MLKSLTDCCNLCLMECMLDTLKFLLPALVPSWRFFDGVAPSPRVEYALGSGDDAAWQEFWPRPAYVSFGQMMRRMLWNPHWNDNLFVVSCAERLVEDPTAHSRDEVYRRICDDLEARQVPAEGFRFRLVFVSRADDGRLQKEVLYVSDEDGGGML
jgi:hypothetical protein